jgi:anaerobic magnesium-protoporphyrin IX monomethyl ester cyclase
MKIRLIEPAPAGMNTFSMILLPRLGLPLIGAVLKERGHDVKIYAPQMAPVVWSDVYDADLVGITSTTSTVADAYRFADDVRARAVPVIMGGSHVTFMADEALTHADYVARGEGGEQLMVELIEALRGDRRLESIKGLSFRRDGGAVHNEPRGFCSVLEELPFPDMTLIHGHENLHTTPMMTSWGCPFNCNFCSVTALFGKKYRFRSADSVLAELRAKRPRKVFFYDDNLAANKRRLKELLRRMIDEDLVTPWSAQVRVDVAKDEELLRLMRDSGCVMVYLGLESVSQETLDRYDKHQTVQDIVDGVRELHRFGIMSHGMFVVGADSDTVQTVHDTVEFAKKNDIDTIMLSALTPLPGTPTFRELEEQGRIFDRRWELYDSHHVVFRPANMSAYELQYEAIKAYRRFYSRRRWLKYFLTFRFTKLLFQSWGMFIRAHWLRDEQNRQFMRSLQAAENGSGWSPPAHEPQTASPGSLS